jgi:gluconokinase
MTVLVIDIGSSSVRAMLFDERAQLIPSTEVSLSYEFDTLPPGASTIDATALQTRVAECVDRVMAHPRAREVEIVGLDTFAGNILGIDADGKPVTPVYTYADTRSAEDISRLARQVDTRASHQRTGCPLHTAYLPGRLAWLRRTQPDSFAAVAQWMDFGTYLYRQWFARDDIPCSYSVASWNGLLHRDALTWDAEWLHLLDLDEGAFPALANFTRTQRGLSNDYANRWPHLHEIPFCLAVGDGAAANLGTGCIDNRHIALTVGTTAALRVATANRLQTLPSGIWNYRVSSDVHLIGGATSEGGNVFAWTRNILHNVDVDTLDQQIAERIADSHGLTLLPLLAGERSPGWRGDATGTIHGLRLSTSPLDIIQAALEGVALRLAIIAGQLAPVYEASPTVIAGGGAINKSPAWAQIIANALNQSLHLTDETEITARGTALLALQAAGKAIPPDARPHLTGRIEPQPAQVERLREARERQQSLYQRLYTEKDQAR